MSQDATVADFMRALRRLVRQASLYPEGHPITNEAVKAVIDSLATALGERREAVIAVVDDAFYWNRSPLAHLSLEYHGLLRDLQERGVETIMFVSPPSVADLYDLAAFMGGVADDLPADGTVRLNERSLGDEDLTGPGQLSRLRTAYSGSLDALRMVTGAMAAQGAFELNSVVMAVEGLFENAVTHSGAALLLATVKSHDEYTFFHSVNTCILALAAGRSVGIHKEDLLPIGVGAILHDIGKVAVDPAVLNYPGRLDPEQWSEIKLHPQEGALAIMAAGGAGHEIAATVALEHHARYDGQGYPNVRRARRPHPFSRLVSVVDTYDAITSRRAYRRAETPHRALQVLLGHAGSMYDADMVTAFIRMVGLYPPGSILQLRSGEIVVVTAPQPEADAPLPVLLVKDTSGFEIMEPEPMQVMPGEVAGQLLPQQTGIDPASFLEQAEVALVGADER